MSLHLYGVIRWPVAGLTPGAAANFGTGIGSPPRPVDAIVHQDLAALASRVHPGEVGTSNVRVLRRDMKAHADVLNRIVAAGKIGAILPFQFGVVVPSEAAVAERVLGGPRARALRERLERLEGAVELKLRATYLEDVVLREVVAEQPQLAAAGAGSSRSRGGSYQSKIETGRRVAAAIRAKRALDAQRLLDALKPVAREIRAGRAGSDMTVLSASFLVGRGAIDRFDRALEQIHARERTRLKLDCVGPLPPFSFTDLKL